MNKVILLGRITKDPELRYTPSNTAVTAFTVAVNRPYNKDGGVDFIDCVAWRNSAEFVSKYFSKGKPILVEGRLQVRSYEDKQGAKRRAYEVICSNVSFVEGVAKSDEVSAHNSPSIPAYETGSNDFQEVEEFDDLPF